MDIAFLQTSGLAMTAANLPSTGASPESAQRFADLIRGAAPPEQEAGIEKSVGEAILLQEELMRGNLEEVMGRLKDARQGNVELRTEDQIELMFRLGAASVNFSAATGIVQNLKSGVQTLMRNQ